MPVLALLGALVLLSACDKKESRAGPTVQAAAPPVRPGLLISRTVLFASPAQFQGRISPDGAKVSWLALRDGGLNLFVADARGQSPPRQVTFGASGVEYHLWTPDSAYILFVRQAPQNQGTRVYALNVQTGDVRDLVPVIKEDKVWLAGVSRNWPNTALVRLRRHGEKFFDLYRVNLKTGGRTLVAKNPGFHFWLTDADLIPRLGLRDTPRGGQVWMLRRDDATLVPLLSVAAPDVGRTYPLRMDVASSSLYLIDGRENGFSALVRLDMPSGDREVLLSGDDGDIEKCLFHPVTGQPLACLINGPVPHWQALASGFAPVIERLEAQLGPHFLFLAATSTMQKLVVYSDAPDRPGRYSLYDLGTGKLTSFFETMPELDQSRLEQAQILHIQARDGLNLLAYFTPAKSPKPRLAPLLLLPQSRPGGRMEYGFDPLVQWLGNRGYNVLEINMRGASGLGRRYQRAGLGAGMVQTADDLADAVQAIGERGLADTSRLGGIGWRFGARAILDLAARPGTALKCALVLDPVLDVADMVRRAANSRAAPSLARALGAQPGKADPAMLDKISPARHAGKIQARVMLLQSRASPLLDPAIARRFVKTVRAHGQDAAMIFFPEITREIFNGPELLPLAALSEATLADCLGGSAEPVGHSLDMLTFEVNAGKGKVPGLKIAGTKNP